MKAPAAVGLYEVHRFLAGWKLPRIHAWTIESDSDEISEIELTFGGLGRRINNPLDDHPSERQTPKTERLRKIAIGGWLKRERCGISKQITVDLPVQVTVGVALIYEIGKWKLA